VELDSLIRVERLTDMKALYIDLEVVGFPSLRLPGLWLLSLPRRVGRRDRPRRSRDEQTDRAVRLRQRAFRRVLRNDEPLDLRPITLDALKRRAQTQPANRHDRLASPQPFITLDAHATTMRVG
jgi:hypothetical protein